MLRRHIVSDSEIADLCRRIYQKHQRALDLIFEHRPDQQAGVRGILVECIQHTGDLRLDRVSKTVVDFAPASWDVPILLQGEGWTTSRRMLMFEFANEPKQVRIAPWLGPGPAETRERLYQRGQRPPFRPIRKLAAKWNNLCSRIFLASTVYEVEDVADLRTEIQKQWAQFVQHDLPPIMAAICAEEWLQMSDQRATPLPSLDAHGADAAHIANGDLSSDV
jgi:hypothetical protein